MEPRTPGAPPRDGEREFGLERGKVFPASEAALLERRVRRLVQSPNGIIRWLHLAPRHRVLELGCGGGFFSVALSSQIPAGQLVLCDLQDAMLRRASAKLRGSGTAQLDSVQADAVALPYRDCSFDAIFVSAVLGEVPNPSRCAEEAARVLRPNGLLAVAEIRGDDDYISIDRLRQLVAPAGFAQARRRRGLWGYTAAFTLER